MHIDIRDDGSAAEQHVCERGGQGGGVQSVQFPHQSAEWQASHGQDGTRQHLHRKPRLAVWTTYTDI